ncbi:hypothetical protein QQS21_005980 [Conoideocrella luteorostrata]|uniref:Uncharacterized protein n=1 Tax=Conoideocrella luteorostrata TaxID=1105319 RepID=A0AAJ0FTC6_9HYPO|nr:hypothetical protein QQS21_005980 [Conoideocrella luteorostrata]
MATAQVMQQIHIRQSHPGFQVVVASQDKNSHYKEEHDKQERYLLSKCAAHLWHDGSYSAICPRPVLVGKHHLQRMEDIHEALTAAITDIVQRWWSDSDARLPIRMPLEPEEEEHLKWLDAQTACGNIPSFAKRLGSWRPDFLVEDLQHGQDGAPLQENFSTTEINARFSFNGYMHEVYGQLALDKAIDEMGGEARRLVSATSGKEIMNGLFELFRHDQPLHLLKEQEDGIDIHMFIDAVERRLGIKPRIIKPEELRLVPHSESKTGYQLYCIADQADCTGTGTDGASGSLVAATKPTVAPGALFKREVVTHDGEVLERVFQVGLELHQREIAALSPELLREVSLRCFNDLRTILLVHDKRMLGIVKQELPRLVARSVLTPQQSSILERGIVDTYLPGSQELDTLLQASLSQPDVKNAYILKPIRGGKGAGILFGDDIDQSRWIETLKHLKLSTKVQPTSYVVQRRIVPRLYDMVLEATGELRRYPLVGTYHVVNGRLLGLGTWRSSGSRIVAICGGGSAICSVMRASL